MLKKYKMGFDIWGALLFLIIMIPNFIWFAVPAPNDILRVDSITKVVDTVASVSQVLMIILLCTLINKERNKTKHPPLIISVIISCLLYFVSWVFYYGGITNAFVILGLTIPPCLAFFFFALGRKNLIAIIPISVFSICHLIYGIVNFISKFQLCRTYTFFERIGRYAICMLPRNAVHLFPKVRSMERRKGLLPK